jgi:copper oxidase (laccase) domain-containing protein
VLGASVAYLRERFGVEPDEIGACLGPSIGACCYQVDAPVRDAFPPAIVDAAFRADGPAHWRLDTRAAARALLQATGVTAVAEVGPCTACDPRFCSYRRSGAGAGRQLSFVGWS